MTIDNDLVFKVVGREVCLDLIADIESELKVHPDLKVTDVIELLQVRAAEFAERDSLEERSIGNCRNCQRPMVDQGGVLYHLGPNARVSMRGCRSASFDWNEGSWDDSISRHWKAAK